MRPVNMKVSTDDAGQVTVELNEAERKRGLQPCDYYKLGHPTPDAVEELYDMGAAPCHATAPGGLLQLFPAASRGRS